MVNVVSMTGRTLIIAIHRVHTFLHMRSAGPCKSSWRLLRQFAPKKVPDNITLYDREVYKPSLKWVEATERKRRRAFGRYAYYRMIIDTIMQRCQINPEARRNLQSAVAAWTAKRYRFPARVLARGDMDFFDNLRRTKQDSEREPVRYGIWDSAIVGCLVASSRGPKFIDCMSEVKLTYANRPAEQSSERSGPGRPKDIDFVIPDGSSKGRIAYSRFKRLNGLMTLGNVLSKAKRSVLESYHAFAEGDALDFLFVTPDARALSVADRTGWHPLFLVKNLAIDKTKRIKFERRILKLREETFPSLEFASEQPVVHGILGLDAVSSWQPPDEDHQIPGAVEVSWDQLKQDPREPRHELASKIKKNGVSFTIRKYIPVSGT